MRLENLKSGKFLRRYKRFLADIEREDGSVLTVHCPNTGAMTGCTELGARAYYSESGNPRRKYRGTLEWLELSSGDRVCINTQRPNLLVKEAIEQRVIPELAGYDEVLSEVTFGCESSRVDLKLRKADHATEDCFVEVKNVTLHEKGIGYFPDAVSQRALKHVRELLHEIEQGNRAVLVFCINHTGIKELRPARKIHYDYALLLQEAASKGLELLAYRTAISSAEIRIVGPVPIRISSLVGD